MEVGHEGERFLAGQAVAIAAAELGGGMLEVNLDSIYELAQRAYPGAEIARASL